MVNRVIRDDPSKGTMHNREPITPKLLFKSLCDFDLWPLYIIGLTFETPMMTPKQYLTLTLRGLGFNTFVTNLLTIPSTVISIVTMLAITYLSEVTGQLTWVSILGQIWTLPFVVYLYVVDVNSASKWAVWIVMTLLLGFPNCLYYPGSPTKPISNLVPSTCDPSLLELSEFKHGPFSDSFGGNVQHVCSGIIDNCCEYLSGW